MLWEGSGKAQGGLWEGSGGSLSTPPGSYKLKLFREQYNKRCAQLNLVERMWLIPRSPVHKKKAGTAPPTPRKVSSAGF
jgi:hypothetical protein